ncbi:MAG TPA: RdgB/HAM1 family non-canonical purine NTP pyrophosphatase [Leptospiraceae bacterium]|nr:RdgB/HAM1 family non-canonical purine NTP pyrophosphatase [Leptospiraceae bacterium]HNM05224.1 RdgB/HAM1 family non-canonical purine NTP pyrophosphatase [Leptospiraceae bacterium]
MEKILLATNNPHKVLELERRLLHLNIQAVTPKSLGISFDAEETGDTFHKNAAIKSETLFQLSGIPCIADDSGICVNALQGEPGVYSARFGRPEFNDRERALYLLERMEGAADRRAHYTCVIAFTSSEGTEYFEGTCEGLITEDYDDEGKFGFGYDPVFYYPPFSERFSRVSPEMKDSVSHRSAALALFSESFLKRKR